MKDGLKNLYLLYGDESYLRQQRKKALLRELETDGSMSFHAFCGDEVDLAELSRLALTLPFPEDHRTILLSDTGYFKGSAPEELLALCEELPETTVLVFDESAADARGALYKLIAKRGAVSDCRKPEKKDRRGVEEADARLRRFAKDYLAQNGRTISGRILQQLISRCGTDMGNLETELAKLVAYTTPPSELPQGGRQDTEQKAVTPAIEISEADLDAICSVTLSETVFDIISAKLSGNTARALALFEELLAQKTAPLQVLYLLAKQYHQIYLVKEMSNARAADAVICEQAGLKDWQLRRIRKDASRMSAAGARAFLEACVDTEQRIKEGNLADRLGLEILLIKNERMG